MYNWEKEQGVLRNVVRPVTEEHRKKLPAYSHSKLECFTNCPMQYYLKYEQKKYSKDTTLALELGLICHRVYELAAHQWDEGIMRYQDLWEVMENGDSQEQIIGLKQIKRKYFEEWFEPDSEGHSYDWKIKQFRKGLVDYFTEMDEWIPKSQEMFFEFVFNDRAIIQGYIDAILINLGGDLLCQDFKTSKKLFPDNKIPTSQQFGIYCMGILNKYGRIPVQCDYKFILLDKTQNALTDGFAKRLIVKLNKTLDAIDKNQKTGEWKPSPSPLCAFCNYSSTNPKAKQYKNECQYYSLWTPDNKVFGVNKIWTGVDKSGQKSDNGISNGKLNGRKLVF